MTVEDDSTSGRSTFLRQLTSSDDNQRNEALDALKLYLQRSSIFDDLELLKLWKGFFYCMWLTASPIPQHRLAQDLASFVIQTLAKANVLPFVDAFWKIMAREWANIDSLRLDKYLRLCRLMLYASLDHLKQCGLDAQEVATHNQILMATPLKVDEPKIPNGLRHHVLDIFVDAIEHCRSTVTASNLGEIDHETLRMLVVPVEHIEQHTKTKSIRKQAKEVLADERLAQSNTRIPPTSNDPAETNAINEDDEFDGFD